MRISEIGSRNVRVIQPHEPLAEAARRLQKHHIGALVVVDERGWPVGIITDRDIVCGQLERKADIHCLIVSDVMTRDPVTVPADADIDRAIETMHAWGVRRAPVISKAGDLVGIVTIDDLLPALATRLSSLSSLVGTQARYESMRRAAFGAHP